MQPDGPRSNDAAADAPTDDEQDGDENDDDDGDENGHQDGHEAGEADEDRGADADEDGDPERSGSGPAPAAPEAGQSAASRAGPRHLRQSWPPTAEIELDLSRDGYDPDPRGDDNDDENIYDKDNDEGCTDGTANARAIGRHRRGRSRRPWLAAGAVAASVTAILIALGAFGANRGNPDAAPTSTSTRPSLVDTVSVVLPTAVPSDPAAPSPTPTATRTATPTPGATTGTTSGTTTGPPTSTSGTTAPPTTTPPTPTPTPTPTGPTAIPVPPHQLVITGAPGRCVDVNGASFTHGNTVQSWACNNSSAQRFTFNANGTLSGNGVCLAPAGVGAGSPLQVRTCGGANQVWQFRSDKSVFNTSASLCLNDPGYPATNRQLTLAACTGAASQQWTYS
jgi:hypothetical protein